MQCNNERDYNKIGVKLNWRNKEIGKEFNRKCTELAGNFVPYVQGSHVLLHRLCTLTLACGSHAMPRSDHAVP